MISLVCDTTFGLPLFTYILAANVVLENTVERTYVGDCFGDRHVGLFLIRGENVVLLGEVVCAQALCVPSHKGTG